MTDQTPDLDSVLNPDTVSVPRFPPTSRYAAIPTTTVTGPDGREITYLRRRFVPPPERFAVVREYAVEQGDRLDRLAATHVGDAELFWRLCDANGVLRPDELTDTVGRRIRITLPEGIPGAGDD
jgi:hypothetical protein